MNYWANLMNPCSSAQTPAAKWTPIWESSGVYRFDRSRQRSDALFG